MQKRISKRLALSMVFGLTLLDGGLVACSKVQSADGFLSDAKEHRQKGDNKAAAIQLKNALQKNPDNAEARYLLGTIYNETGDAQSAEKELRKALALGIAAEKVVPALGTSLAMLGQYQKALDETNQVATEAKDAELSTLRGNAYLALGKSAEAKASFERALKEKADFPDALIGLGKHAMVQRDIETAMRFAEQAVTTSPKDGNAWLFKADLLRAKGQLEQALATYDEVLKLSPGDTGVRLTKASLEIGAKKFDDARKNIEAARKSAPGAPMVFYTQALLDFTQGKPAVALESIQQALRVAPDHPPSNLLAARIQLALGATQQAEQHLKKVLEKYPTDLYARKMLASTLLKNGDTQRALTIVNAALKDAPEDPQVLALAGESYMKAKDFSKATTYFDKASTLAPQAAAIRTSLALSSLAQGKTDRAVAELELATAMDAKSLQAGILLVMVHGRLKEYDKALAAAKALEKEQPDNPVVQHLKGGVYLGKKDILAARSSFEKALSLQPTYYQSAAALAQIDLQEKKPDAAKKRFEAILERDPKNIQAMAALAGVALTQGKKQEATNWFERANRENPEEVQLAGMLAAHYLSIGEKQKALTLMQKLQVTQPANPDVLSVLARVQLANNDQAGALGSYKKLAAALPASAPAQLRIASTYAEMQNFEAATDAVKKSLSLQPDYLDAQLVQIGLEVRAGRHEQALGITRQIQKQRGDSPVGYIAEGDVLTSQKKFDAAVKAYEKAFMVNKSGQMLVKLHESLGRAGKAQEADARMKQWLKEHPNDTHARLYLAATSLANQRNKEAIEQYQAVLQQDQKNVMALNNLAFALQQEKDPRAMEYAEKALALAPDNPGVLDTAGWILVEQGNTTRGLPLLQKAASLAPSVSDIRYHLAQALVKSGDNAGAKKELEQLLASGKPISKDDEAKLLLKQIQ